MKVHIVVSDQKSDWIIARLARHLVHYNGWTVGRRPSPTAKANLYFPYIDAKFHTNPKGTKSVAFVTHREGATKGRIWNRLMPGFDLRVCMAKRYAKELESLGPTVHVPVCVELDKFTPHLPIDRSLPRIGVGGTVYRSGRKGEDLALKLKRYNSHRWVMKASGKKMGESKDWPIPTKHYLWAQMEKFYRSLSVFVCTSLIEGGPVTVLEALACGRPVVIPEGVGFEAELPRASGIYRYEAGNYAAMVKAIERALRCKASPEKLRGYVEDRTPERWARGWRTAVEGLFPAPPVVPKKPWVPLPPVTEENAGIYIVAYGRHAHDCAYHLIRTIHKYSPGISVCLVCEGFRSNYEKPVVISGKGKGQRYDDKGYCQPLDWWGASKDRPLPADKRKRAEKKAKLKERDDASLRAWQRVLEPTDVVLARPMKDRRARSQKTLIWKLAPALWKYVLYLDADILISRRLNFFFDLLRDGWDMVVTLSPPQGPLVRHAQRKKYRDENVLTTRRLGGNHWLQIAGGVWAFRRNERTQKFLSTFHGEWKRFQHCDQQAMMRAYWKVPLRIWILGTEFNTFMHHKREAGRSLGIRHFATAARAWIVRHDGRALWRKWSKKL